MQFRKELNGGVYLKKNPIRNFFNIKEYVKDNLQKIHILDIVINVMHFYGWIYN